MIRQSLLSILARGFGSAAAFLFALLVGRKFGLDASGAFFSGLAVLALVGVAARAGMDTIVMREVAAALQDGRLAEASDTMWRCLAVSAFLGLIGAAAMAMCAAPLASAMANEALFGVLLWLAAGLLPTAVTFVGAEALKARGSVVVAQAQQVLWVPLIALALLAWLGGGSGVRTAAMCYAAASWVTALPCLWLLLRHFGRPTRAWRPRHWLGTREGWLLCIAGLTVMANGYADLLMLGLVADASAVGMYGAATRWALLMQIIPLAMAGVVGPRLAGLWRSGNKAETYAFARRMARLGVLVALVPTTILVLAPAALLSMFGPGFGAGDNALRVLAVSFLISQALGFGGLVLTMTNRSRALLFTSLTALAVNVLGALALSAGHGALGAAVAAGAAMILARLLPAALVWRQDRALITM